MLMTSWIGLILSNVSLSIVIPRAAKGEVGGYQDAQECFFLVGKFKEAATSKRWKEED